MFFEPYQNSAAGVACRDGGLKQNNPVEKSLNEAKAIWGKEASFDIVLSIGSGRARLRPSMPSSTFVIEGWLRTLFDNFMASFNGEEQWDSFYKMVDDPVKVRTKRLNVHYQADQEPSLDDTGKMQSMKETAEDFTFFTDEKLSQVRPGTEDPILEVALLLRAGFFFFHPSSVEFNKDRSVAVVEGTIYCRLEPRSIPCRELVSLSAGFEVQGHLYPMPTYEEYRSNSKVKIAFQHDMQSAEQHVHIHVKSKDDRSAPISGSPIPFKVGDLAYSSMFQSY